MSTVAKSEPALSLLNRSFVASCLSNLLFFFSFYLLIPVLPLYLIDELHAGKSAAGIILSSYTIAALIVRPFSGMLVDNLQRRPLYLICYFAFAAYFLGYLLAGTLFILGLVRCTHGFVFGIATTSANTLAIDTVPIGKLGRGIGIYGTMTSVAMALGPMAGLLLLSHFSFKMVFAIAFLTSMTAFLIGSTIQCATRIIPVTNRKFSFGQIFLAQSLPMAFCIFLIAFLYGVLLNYLSLFARERGIITNPGYFFCLLAVGLIMSRFIAGKMIDNGHICRTILIGKVILIASVFWFVYVPAESVFFGAALLIGFGFGLISPSYQTIFIRLAHKEQRGTANSTYLTAWDGGMGIAILLGGLLLEWTTLTNIYWFCILLLVVSMIFFALIGIPHFKRYRLS
ncbi:MAG: MFS transporter [Planctomycetaceae bacterium]|jgi:MFS family permease|nr:MFS transporter [Planctomycetaceae bacterium]